MSHEAVGSGGDDGGGIGGSGRSCLMRELVSNDGTHRFNTGPHPDETLGHLEGGGMDGGLMDSGIGAGVRKGKRPDMRLRWIVERVVEGFSRRIAGTDRSGSGRPIVVCAEDGVGIGGVGGLLGNKAGPVGEICHGEVGIDVRVGKA